MRRGLAAVLVLVMSLCMHSGALAELKRGSRGDDVVNLQTMLIEMGFLQDKADGVYGKKTEAAVRQFQRFAQIAETGVYNDETELWVMDVYFTATGVMADDGMDPEELQEIYPHNCSWEAPNEWGAQFCWRHIEADRLERLLNLGNPPTALRTMLETRLASVCEAAIEEMYDEWAAADDGAEEDTAEEQRIIFEEALEENRLTWAKTNTAQYPFLAISEEAMWLESQMIDLCMDLHGMEAQDGEE